MKSHKALLLEITSQNYSFIAIRSKIKSALCAALFWYFTEWKQDKNIYMTRPKSLSMTKAITSYSLISWDAFSEGVLAHLDSAEIGQPHVPDKDRKGLRSRLWEVHIQYMLCVFLDVIELNCFSYGMWCTGFAGKMSVASMTLIQ